MIKNYYLKEIAIATTQAKGQKNNSKDVSKIQSWLTLYAFLHPNSGTATSIDGDFGSATEKAIKNYQASLGITQDGVVTRELFQVLSNDLKVAFSTHIPGSNLRELIVNAAGIHLKSNPRELIIKRESNSGPWVRAYMDGNEGSDWLWCMGFVQTILDCACSQIGQRFTDIIKRSFSCDTVATAAKIKGNFVSYNSVRTGAYLVQPGDIFLLQSKNNSIDWTHTGIIIKTTDSEVFETIEGNTNADGSENGYAVLRRTRNFMQSKLDIIRIN